MGSMTFHDVGAAVAIRVNALFGTDPVELQITYSTRPLTDELFDSSIFPFNAIRDAVINAESKIASTVARSADRSLRAYITSLTNPLASGDALPSLDVNGTPIIGNLGAVRDSADPLIVCKRHSVAEVERRNLAAANAVNIWLLSGAMFALASNTILHTQTSVLVQCCVYDAATQTAAFDADLPILFPDSLAEAYIQGALAMLVRDDEFTAQATQYANYFGTTLAAIPAGVMEDQAA